MKPALLGRLLGLALLTLLGLGGCGDAPPPAPPPAAAADTAQQLARGAYLARLGNCAGCHTVAGGAAYAGGRGFDTRFGRVEAGNLTPHPTGLGGWSADDFWNALHRGRSRDGRRLLPVFPYPSYTHVTRADSDALFAYLQSLPPVDQPNRPHALHFPYDSPLALAAWQALYFRPAEPDVALPRGAYLVQGLGHCAACHAPRNALGASAEGLRGGLMELGAGERWWAPSLHPQQGQPAPSAAQLVALLRDGVAAHGSAAGPMATVVAQSLQHWQEADLQAVADYLLALPVERPAPPPDEPVAPGLAVRGAELYQQRCADCHGARGEGRAGAYPPLAGNPTVLQPELHTLVQVLLHGGFAPSTRGNPRPHGMGPQFLSDEDMAAVLTHIRTHWGNQAGPVSALAVLKAR